MSISKDEQWILDLFAVGQGHPLSPKQINSLWANTFADRDISALREAVSVLQKKGLVEVSEGGFLSLTNKY